MKFTVMFEAPRVYQVGVLKAEARVWGLHVNAPDAAGAERHALTVTQGRARIMETVEGFADVEPAQ